jgi:hypothetical protein
VPRPFYANWKTDTVRFSHRATYPMSCCTLASDMYAVPTRLEFTGGGLTNTISVAPYQAFTTPSGWFGDYRISPSAPGTASAAAFVSP